MKKLHLVLILATSINVCAQDDGIRATNVLIPEAYTFKFNSAGSVDFHGDYTASIPLMTVPGRGGMDYSINLSYKSGITTDQRATWVGLGWNLNPGSITRVVNGIPDNITGFMFPNGVTENGAIVNYDATAGTGGWKFPDNDHLDFFLVNIPGVVSGLVIPVAADGDSTPDYVFQEYNGWSIGFGSGTTFNRLHVPAIDSPTLEYTDIGFIHLRDPNGNVYVFGLPLRSEMVWYNPAPSFIPRFIIEYVSSWQLTSILSPDFSMANYNNGDLIPSENAGTWVKFEYNYPYNSTNARVRNIRPLHFDRSSETGNGKDPFGLLTQTTYLSKIITPTHEAVFETTPRSDISFLSPYSTAYEQKTGVIGDYTNSPNGTTGTFIKPLRLDRIKLYKRFPSSTFTNHQVEFKYAATGQELCRYGYSLTVSGIALNGIGKTTLKEVVIGGESSGHLYRFKYTDEIDGFNPVYIASPDPRVGLSSPIQAIEKHEGGGYSTESYKGRTYYRARSGRMGFLFALASELSGASAVIQNTKAAAAWSLRTIEYPTGAVDTIVYELDDFDKTTDQTNSSLSLHYGWWDNFAPDESGLRVAYISSYDPITAEARKTIYQYEGGHLPGLPISFLRNQNAWIGVDQLRAFLFGYSSSEVEYKLVKTLFADGSRSETRYTSVEDAALFGDYDQQSASYNYVLVQDKGFSRGKPLYTHHYDYNNRLTSRQSNTYVNTKLYSGYPPADLMLAMDPNNWSYYVGGKRLSESWTIKRVIDSTYQYEWDVAGSLVVPQIGVTNYAYNNYLQMTFQNVLLRNSRLQTTYAYVHEMGLAESGTFKTKNMLNSLAYKKTVETKNNKSVNRSHILYSWAQFNGDYRIDTVFVWMDADQDSTADEGEWVPTKIVLSYDDYGNPLSIRDANGTVTNYEWSATYQGSRLTKKSTMVDGIELARRYTYNVLHLPDSEEDENGQKTTYLYDAVGRLISVKGPNNETLKSYIYNFKNTGTITGGGY